MTDEPQRVRWHYPNSEVLPPDREVEGSPDKFRELCETVGDHPHGKPELVDDAGGLEAQQETPPAADEGPSVSSEEGTEPEREPADLLSGGDGGWYDVEGLEGRVRGKDAALEAAQEVLEG